LFNTTDRQKNWIKRRKDKTEVSSPVVNLCSKPKLTTMGKDITKNLVDQPIFKQLIKMLPRERFDLLVKEYGSDRYYKTFFRGMN